MQRDNLVISIAPRYKWVYVSFTDETGSQCVYFQYNSLNVKESFTPISGLLEVKYSTDVRWMSLTSATGIYGEYSPVAPNFHLSELEEYLPIDNRHYWFSDSFGNIIYRADSNNIEEARINYPSTVLYELETALREYRIPNLPPKPRNWKGVYPLTPSQSIVFNDLMYQYSLEIIAVCRTGMIADEDIEEVKDKCLRTFALHWLLRQHAPYFFYPTCNEIVRQLLGYLGIEEAPYLGNDLKNPEAILHSYIEYYLDTPVEELMDYVHEYQV